MRQIDWTNFKFRGEEEGTEKIIAGDTVRIEKGEVVAIMDAGGWHDIQPDSVKQFLFEDAHGNEVYTTDYIGDIGDTVGGQWEADYGAEFCAERLELREVNNLY